MLRKLQRKRKSHPLSSKHLKCGSRKMYTSMGPVHDNIKPLGLSEKLKCNMGSKKRYVKMDCDILVKFH
jgi:hypothetical protein